MKTKIDNTDFQVDPLGYMFYKTEGFEICIEPCLNGADIAIYDADKNLLEPKYCTNIDYTKKLPLPHSLVFFAAVDHQVNELYQKYIVKDKIIN